MNNALIGQTQCRNNPTVLLFRNCIGTGTYIIKEGHLIVYKNLFSVSMSNEMFHNLLDKLKLLKARIFFGGFISF